MTTGTPIARLYFFDDLTYHLRRICRAQQLPDADTNRLLTTAVDRVHQALAGLDPAHQSAVQVTWEHACTQLAFDLHRSGASFDLLVSQGCNGQHAGDSLLAEFTTAYDRPLAAATANVRSTHLLTDPADAFHSDFRIAASSGAPLDEQCRTALGPALSKHQGNTEPLRVAVFDDCIQTGQGTQAVTEHLIKALPTGQAAEIHTIGFIACQATQQRFAERGWHPAQGVLLPGATYPDSWDTDIYFLKDLILNNAIRYTNNTSEAYIDNPEWMKKIFARDPAAAAHALNSLRTTLTEQGIYQHLLDL
ncbi:MULTISPECIES: hypothetical protein [Streptomyces]|uniref:Phosphoribosyltransferase n=2 Tax=Streptomyces TaxID=1883 RepID=A0ABV9J6D5_9ACTN